MPLGFTYAGVVGTGPAGIAHAAGVALLCVLILCCRQWAEFLDALRSKKLIVSGIVFAVVNAIGASAMVLVPLPTFSVMVQLSPLVGLLLAPLFQEKVTRLDWLALPLACAGGVIVVGSGAGEVPLLGWVLLAGEIILVALSVHLFARARREDPRPVIPAVAAMMSWGCLLLLVQPSIFLLDLWSLGALALSGLALALGNGLIYSTFDKFPAHRTLLLKPLSTVTTVVAAVFLLGQPWSANIILGGILIALSGTIVAQAQKRTEAQP